MTTTAGTTRTSLAAAALVAAALLAPGCGPSLQEKATMTCQNAGYQSGTDKYADCYREEYGKLQQEQDQATMAALAGLDEMDKKPEPEPGPASEASVASDTTAKETASAAAQDGPGACLYRCTANNDLGCYVDDTKKEKGCLALCGIAEFNSCKWVVGGTCPASGTVNSCPDL